MAIMVGQNLGTLVNTKTTAEAGFSSPPKIGIKD
jgi:hypothetical protein